MKLPWLSKTCVSTVVQVSVLPSCVKLVTVKKPSKTSTEARSMSPNGKSAFAPSGPITSPSVSAMLKRIASGLGLGLSGSSHTVSSLPLLKIGIRFFPRLCALSRYGCPRRTDNMLCESAYDKPPFPRERRRVHAAEPHHVDGGP